MPKTDVFETYSQEYDEWFVKNYYIYLSELNAIKELIQSDQNGLEVGVGTGRFAIPLGIKIGVEPSLKMTEIARRRGVKVYNAVAEELPFCDEEFDFVLMVTTICFVDDVEKALSEAYRVLKPNGYIIVAFVDRDSELGRLYQQNRNNSRFYQEATFYTTDQVTEYLGNAAFSNFIFKQIMISKQQETVQVSEDGYGQGSFVIIKASRR